MSMPAGSATGTPDGGPRELDASLADLLAVRGTQTVRVIDVGTGRALGERVARPIPADPAGDAAMARLASTAFAAATADGGFVDLVLASPRATHVLAPGPYGSVVALRLGPGGDVAAARRALASTQLAAALRAGHPGAPGLRPTAPPTAPPPARPTSVGALPQQRASGRGVLHAVPLPRAPEPSLPGERQPALASLSGAPMARRTGRLAAQVLGDLAAAAVPLPRRGGGAARPGGVLATTWSSDLGTLQRVLDGLRRLA
ncbi:hypothetical protein ACQEVB_28600 [Pseudonocardia sp. CA-107938]|uniref:hypothetical protein n=1 Tax=Pseudonocardia sp. CA-107938 TaxID=3240021 RepID=UPI003D8E02A5